MDADEVFEAALEAGAENVESSDEVHEITTAVEDLTSVREALESAFGTPNSAKLAWRPQNLTPMEADQAATLFKMIEVLDEHDDVQIVYSNFDVSDEVMAQLAGD